MSRSSKLAKRVPGTSTGGAPADPDALRELAAARQVLLPRLHAEGEGWQASATLHGPGDRALELEGPVAADPAAALAAWRRQPVVVQALGRPAVKGLRPQARPGR